MSGRVPSRGYEGRDRGRRPDQPAGSPFSEGAVSRYYGGSSHQASSSRAKLASAGVSSSTKGSEASVTTVASESEDEYRSKSSRSHHRSGHHRRKQQRSERSPGAGIAGESLSPSDMSSSYDRRPQQQQSAMASVSLLQRPLKQTAGEEVQHGRSKNQHPRHGKKHEAKQRDNRMPDASQRDPVRPYPPLGTLQQGKASPSSFHQASPTTVQPKQIKGEYRYFDKMMRVHRRQSLLAQKASAGNPELLIRPQHFKQERHKHVESVNARGESSESRHAVGKRKILNGDVFARPVYNELFETNPSKNTAVFQKRTSVIAALVRPRNWRDGSQILRPSEFGRLDNKASNVSEDPFLDPSCSFLINSELFEHEPPNLERKHGSVFVALPIPSSGITLDPREALAEAGWVKSHPNDPVETTGGIGLSEKTDDQLRRALQVRSTSKGGGRARKGDDKLSGKSLSSNSRDTRKGGAPRSMPSSDKRSAAHSKTRNSNAPENSGEDVGKQMVIEPDLWSQGSPVDPATVWQEEEASFLSGEGSRVDGSSPRENSLDSGSESSEFDSLTTGRAVAASPASQVNRSNPPGSQDLWSLDSQSDPATAWQLQAVGAYPSKDSPPAPPQDNQFQVSLSPDPGSGFDTDPQLGDGMSNIGLENDRQLGDWAGRVPRSVANTLDGQI
ncbi:hypothetical protein R1sor_027347 [Riccia sorocarpa]|uniref:Uncharacterized protein n=1 Tax=Riccia sorocarpa TaxID=122646 RepID=A0ABD3GG35_9MARC